MYLCGDFNARLAANTPGVTGRFCVSKKANSGVVARPDLGEVGSPTRSIRFTFDIAKDLSTSDEVVEDESLRQTV